MTIKSIGRKDYLDVGRYTLATPVNESDETREEVVDVTRRVERIKGLNMPNPAKDAIKGKYTLATPVEESDELREEVVDETRRLECVKGLYGPNGVKDSTKRNSIDILV